MSPIKILIAGIINSVLLTGCSSSGSISIKTKANKTTTSQDLKDYADEKQKEAWTKFEKELDITIPEDERENFYQTMKAVEEDNKISQKTKEEVLDHLIERYKN